MAAFTQITLDTSPPAVTCGTPKRYGSTLGIPYTVDEDGILLASYVPADQVPLDVLVLGKSFWVLNAPRTSGTLVVTTRDSVWNVGSDVYTVQGGVSGGQIITGRYRGQITGGIQAAIGGEARLYPEETRRKVEAYHRYLAWQVAYGVRIKK